jgi:hypothetical protein
MPTAVLLLLWNIGVPWADQQITDPKRWCDNLMSIIAEKDTARVAQEFHDSAGGRVKREDVDAALASLSPTLALAGSFHSRDLVIERRYGQSVADFTYVLFFDSIDLFFRCRLHKRDDYWRAAAFSFNSNLDNLEPP